MPSYPLYQAVILALVQGLTEFLPISSSAHLDLFPWLFGWEDPGLAFDIALHLGTLVAVLLYFFHDWWRLLAHGLGLRSVGDPDLDANPLLLWWIAAATVPAVIAGLLSRSGITITAGLSRGYDRASAARFSFLLSTPAVAGAAVLTAYKLHKAGGIPPRMHTAFLVGLLVSALSGTCVVAFLMRYLRHHTMRIFVLYRVVVGILIIALALFRR